MRIQGLSFRHVLGSATTPNRPNPEVLSQTLTLEPYDPKPRPYGALGTLEIMYSNSSPSYADPARLRCQTGPIWRVGGDFARN